jgi:Lrp/AsnC family leucine-responsive transcriptional regulator
MQLDHIDQQIIALLQQDARLSHKQIGSIVHRTGQAVGVRVQQLIAAGIIQQYSIRTTHSHLQFIQLYLNAHQQAPQLEQLLKAYSQILHIYKVAGSACYVVESCFEPEALAAFIEQLSAYCRYTLQTVIKEIR